MRSQEELKQEFIEENKDTISSVLTDEFCYRVYLEFDYEGLHRGNFIRQGPEWFWCLETFGPCMSFNPYTPVLDNTWVSVCGCYGFKKEEDKVLFEMTWL